mgnify:CR=1 FL=1
MTLSVPLKMSLINHIIDQNQRSINTLVQLMLGCKDSLLNITFVLLLFRLDVQDVLKHVLVSRSVIYLAKFP